MMKYLIGLGALVVVVAGYFLLFPAAEPPPPAPVAEAPSPAPQPAAPPPAAPAPVAQQDATPEEEALLEEMAADIREDLPSAVTDTLTQTDALFLPRMRIMEYTYVSTAADPRGAVPDLRALIEARTETLCLEGRQMFQMGTTLRNSFEDRDGNLFHRVYLLPEQCRQFY